MWEFLKTLLGLFQPRKREEKIEDKVKQRLVFLHKALYEYHAGYEAYTTESSKWNYNNWIHATEWLKKISEGIELEIHVFDTQLYQCIQHYLQEIVDQSLETRWDEGGVPMAALAKKGKRADCEEDFRHATEELRRYMKERMIFGEIQNAHAAYKRKRLWFNFSENVRRAAQLTNRNASPRNHAGDTIFHVRKHIRPHI